MRLRSIPDPRSALHTRSKMPYRRTANTDCIAAQQTRVHQRHEDAVCSSASDHDAREDSRDSKRYCHSIHWSTTAVSNTRRKQRTQETHMSQPGLTRESHALKGGPPSRANDQSWRELVVAVLTAQEISRMSITTVKAIVAPVDCVALRSTWTYG